MANIYIKSAEMRPNPVETGEAFLISVEVREKIVALVDDDGAPLVDADGAFLCAPGGTQVLADADGAALIDDDGLPLRTD